uniref:Transposase n=1 Tax=Ascaris lumbricoides TaxID=6252 RepID=A0A0M3IE00_ASCLU
MKDVKWLIKANNISLFRQYGRKRQRRSPHITQHASGNLPTLFASLRTASALMLVAALQSCDRHLHSC